MICIKTEIPKEICEIDDELKAIYNSQDSVCIWVFKSREDRNNFMNETVGMNKEDEKNNFHTIMNKLTNLNFFLIWVLVLFSCHLIYL